MAGGKRTLPPDRPACYPRRMTEPTQRPSYAPENRSPNGGKILAIGTFVLLLLGGLATLIVVLMRGSSGITPPPQVIPSARDVVAPEPAAADTPPERRTLPESETQ